MKKSILWRAILTAIVIAAWTAVLFPLQDQDYLETFRKKVSLNTKSLEKALEARERRSLIEEKQAAFAKKQPGYEEKAFKDLPEYLRRQFYSQADFSIEEDLKARMESFKGAKRSEALASIKAELEEKLEKLLAKTDELKKASDLAAAEAEKKRAEDGKTELVAARSYENIIVELASGDSGKEGFDEYTRLADYVPMHSKKAPSNSDVAYFVRNAARSRVKFGLDLQGGTEFTITFDKDDVAKLNKNSEQSFTVESTRDRIIEILRNRVDPHGVKEVEIRPSGESAITLRTPSTDAAEIASIRTVLDQQAILNFYIVADQNDQWISEKVKAGDPRTKGYKMLPYRDKSAVTRKIWVRETAEEVSGNDISEAFPTQGEFGQWQVAMHFKTSGAAKMGSTTSNNLKKRMAIVLDGTVYSAPTIQSRIDARGQITGDFTQQEAQSLGVVLQSGALPVATEIDSELATDPTLGAAFIKSGVFACLIGMALVVLFMVGYYRIAGIVAVTALAFNILLIFGSLPLVHAALTLPGIAGIVLTIGMAVDANVLIFERIREEINNGKSIPTAVKNGYSRAFWTILDANLTTLFTAFFLYTFGSGAIKGFAVTLSLGIIASMFTALYVTRWIFDFLVEYNILNITKSPKLLHTRINKEGEKPKTSNIQFLAFRGKAKFISIALILASIAIFGALNKKALSIDFRGGAMVTMQYNKKIAGDQLSASLTEAGYGNARVTYKGTIGTSLVEIILGEVDKSKDTGADVLALLNTRFPDAGFSTPNVSVVGGQVSWEFGKSAILSIVFALLVIVAYISFRFEFGYAAGAVAALAHDVAICTGVYLLFGEISLPVVAALLTIIGYSLNDTIVVFDRVRENIDFYGKKKKFLDIVNESLNQTLSRTVLTSLTTLLVVLTLLIFGGGAVRDFSIVMLTGIIVGTYSSLFIATPVMVFVHNKLLGDPTQASKDAAEKKQEVAAN